MKKILQIIFCISFSLNCHSMKTAANFGVNIDMTGRMVFGDSFLKISNNEYAQYHYEPVANQTGASVGRITDTHIRTFGGVYPDFMWNIQLISYAVNSVIFFKDCNNNCFIDIYESRENPNKCRIIGTNGRDIHVGHYCFSIYDVLLGENSFTENDNKLIFVDSTGTYIVSAAQNPIDVVVSVYVKTKRFDFKGQVIKISSIYGNRLINDRQITSNDFSDGDNLPPPNPSQQNAEMKLTGTFLLNCSRRTPAVIGTIFAPLTKLYPAMLQIEKITEVKLTSPPPSKKSIIKRIVDLLGLGIMGDMLTVKDGKVYLLDVTPTAFRGEIPGIVWSLADAAIFYSYAYPLQNFIPMTDQGIQWSDYVKTCTEIDLLVKTGMLKEYIFDTSAQAILNRKQIAAQPWDNI